MKVSDLHFSFPRREGQSLKDLKDKSLLCFNELGQVEFMMTFEEFVNLVKNEL